MAYATPDELATALAIRVTVENEQLLQDCLDAAATEIDHVLPIMINPPDPLVNRTNVNRAVEWYKAPAAYNGGVGFDQTGVLTIPTSGFERHAAALLALKAQWGIG